MIVNTFLEFTFYLIYSLIVFFIAFYIPGKYFLSKLKKTKIGEAFILSLVLGISLWGLQGYILGYLNLRFLTYLYLLFFILKTKRKDLYEIWKSLRVFFKDKVFAAIVIFGTPVAIVTVFSSGLPGESVGFFGINPIDGSYHLALMESIIKSIPPEEPGMAGQLVTNYHFWSDLVLAELVRIFKLPSVNLFYQFFPLFVSFVYSIAGYQLCITVFKSRNAARFFAFFLYFAGNLDYLFMFIFSGKWDFTINSLDNGALVFTNPPRILAQVLLIGGLIAVYRWLQRKNISFGILAAVILGTLVGFKVYVGIFAGLGMGLVFLIFLFRKDYKHLIPVVVFGVLSFIIFFPANKNSGGIFWSPFSWPRHFFSEGTASSLMWHLQLDEFKAHNNSLRINLMFIQMTFFFLLITFGTRFLGFLGMIAGIKKVRNDFYLLLVFPTLVCIFLGIFFLQQSGVFEIFNFIAVSGIVMSFFSAFWLSEMVKFSRSKNLFIKVMTLVVVFLVLGATVPRTMYDARRYYNLYKLKSGFIVSASELGMFNEMRKNIPDNSLILTDIKDSLGNYSPYVSAFSGKKMYFSGEGILKAHGLDVSDRKDKVVEIFELTDPGLLSDMLKSEGIGLVFVLKSSSTKTFEDKSYFSKLYESDRSVVYKVNQNEKSGFF